MEFRRVLFRSSGLSWLGVDSMATVPSGNFTSHAHPLPKIFMAAVVSCSWNAESELNFASIALASSPVGANPPFPSVGHQKEWLAWPPPRLRTAVRTASGTASRFATSSHTVFSASSGYPVTATFRSEEHTSELQ